MLNSFQFVRLSACALAFLASGIAQAQTNPQQPADTSKPQTSTSPRVGQGPDANKNRAPESRRWGLGAIISYVPLNLMKGGTATTTTTPAATVTSVSGARPLGGGVAAYFYITKNLSLNLDFIYRRTGFQVTDQTNDALMTTYFSRTRGNYFDFPLLARYHSARYHLLRAPVFIEGGGTLRYVEQITTSTTVDTTTNSAVVSTCCTEVPVRPNHRAAFGATVGGGLRLLRDELGVQLIPEVRYTRWLEYTFSMPPTRSNPNQLEVLLSITF